MKPLTSFCQTFGLHPFVGFGMFTVDWMLFGGEAATLGVSWVISVPVGLALTIPSILLQKHSFGDSWGTAIGKGMMVGILTAIPLPLPSLVTFTGGALGVGKLMLDKKTNRQIDKQAQNYLHE